MYYNPKFLWKKSAILLSFIVCSLSLSAQTADDIIEKYINALGGKEKLLSINNVYMEGSMDANGTAIAVKYWIVRKKAMRYEYIINGMTNYDIITTDSGWVYSPMMGQKQAEPMTASMVKSSQPELDPEGLLMNYKANGYKVEYKGKDEVDGNTAYKIYERIGDSTSNTYYIDTNTYYILRITTKANINGKVMDLSRDFSDYKKTEQGYIFPMGMSLGMAMGGEVKFTVTKVNTDMDPSLFKPKR